MREFKDFSAKIRNFKCFGDELQGFECFKHINLIIGRNNSGKSSLLDLIDRLTKGNYEFPRELWHAGNRPEVIAHAPLYENELKAAFPENTRGGGIPAGNHWIFGERFIGANFQWSLSKRDDLNSIKMGDCKDSARPLDKIQEKNSYLIKIAGLKQNPFSGKEFRRIFAERNIVPELDNQENLEVSGSGDGVTNIIQNFINKAHLESDLVERTLLNELNTVFKPDASFKDIVCQQLNNGTWEIYLEEGKKGRIPLSNSGSGLKTIILVLVYIHLIPKIAKKSLSNFVFGFEELENNLHPALLRRLMSYLYQQAKHHGFIIFLTTHSNVEIDLFSKNEDAQIVHVTHNGQCANCRTAKTYIDNKGILDDLDVRASDLLQSNGVIWVEGPSDRIYINRWITLWSNGELSEGNHYQCVFYGGRLLSHLSSIDPELVDEGVAILRVNRNSAILIDSDNRNDRSRLNETKTRVATEITNNNGFAWITKGKEIENYIPASALTSWLNIDQVKQVEQYGDFFDYLDQIKPGEGKHYRERKPLLAEQLSPYITRENIQGILDLSEKLDDLCKVIQAWNNNQTYKDV